MNRKIIGMINGILHFHCMRMLLQSVVRSLPWHMTV